MFNSSTKNIKINIVVFSIVGLLYFLYSFYYLSDQSSIKANPLYFEGSMGLIISIVGGVFAYYLFVYDSFPIYKIILVSFLLFIVWWGGMIYIGTYLKGVYNTMGALILIGVLTFMYYGFIGAINGLVGIWISIINLLITAEAIMSHNSIEPLIWTDILGLVGTNDPVIQWGIVAVSTFLGISEEGYKFFMET